MFGWMKGALHHFWKQIYLFFSLSAGLSWRNGRRKDTIQRVSYLHLLLFFCSSEQGRAVVFSSIWKACCRGYHVEETVAETSPFFEAQFCSKLLHSTRKTTLTSAQHSVQREFWAALADLCLQVWS